MSHPELQQTLHSLRNTLAKKRAARKTQTNTDICAFESVSQHLASQSENLLLEQSFRAYSVLNRLHELNIERQQSLFANSVLDKQTSLFDTIEESAKQAA
jgi:hypothetical protein